MSIPEIKSTSGVLLIAGSETTATLLAAATYYLLAPGNEHILEESVKEIRTTFKSEEEINMTNIPCVIYASHHRAQNFKNPENFAPERWLDDPEYAGDQKGAFQPFSLGPRNCIGRNLAFAEMRLILARIIWNFDLEIAGESKSWAKNMKIFLMWEKPPLYVNLKPVVRS
ncbi:hypothetical protein DSL72_002703 [Monilinia vaccinii-corymbosi]|uniref:Cytochrome P450 n=1 Tax=Monilinia vaccinii-corymbosi TaxID=61207 RepID=A0A8A3PD80_9HELO|nr:hypothetical protein DSL72_002703 [Monilinia vaccinii-corymbosi]